MDSSLRNIYNKIPYLQEHKKAYIEYYRDVNNDSVFRIMRKKKKGTVEEIAKITFGFYDYNKVWDNARIVFDTYKIRIRIPDEQYIFPCMDTIYKQQLEEYVINKINSRIEMRKTGGIFIQ